MSEDANLVALSFAKKLFWMQERNSKTLLMMRGRSSKTYRRIQFQLVHLCSIARSTRAKNFIGDVSVGRCHFRLCWIFLSCRRRRFSNIWGNANRFILQFVQYIVKNHFCVNIFKF